MVEFNYQQDFHLGNEMIYSAWLEVIASSEKRTIGDLSFVFCNDEFLLDLNRTYLDHDTLTDIITFDYSVDDMLHGEIYISVERVRENAADFNVEFLEELHRVMAHGILHLSGYGDKEESEVLLMRSKEEEKMNMFHVKQ